MFGCRPYIASSAVSASSVIPNPWLIIKALPSVQSRPPRLNETDHDHLITALLKQHPHALCTNNVVAGVLSGLNLSSRMYIVVNACRQTLGTIRFPRLLLLSHPWSKKEQQAVNKLAEMVSEPKAHSLLLVMGFLLRVLRTAPPSLFADRKWIRCTNPR